MYLKILSSLGGNLVAWRSKKHGVVSQSSAEAENRPMALGICTLAAESFVRISKIDGR